MLHKPLYDITPFTALDYPDHLATIFWFAKCDMQCAYCYNKDIVFGEGKMTEEDAISFLKSRIGLLEGVVLSGGEATLYSSLIEFCQKIKKSLNQKYWDGNRNPRHCVGSRWTRWQFSFQVSIKR